MSTLSASSRTTSEWQQLDHAHQVHPFTDQKALHGRGVRVITGAQGVYIWDSEGNRFLDGMAGSWCVNVGYGRKELTQAVQRQMKELPYYNNFFQTAGEPGWHAEHARHGSRAATRVRAHHPSARVLAGRVIVDGGPIAHGYTYSGHPTACAGVIANLDIMKRERIVDHVREVASPYFFQKLQELAQRHPSVKCAAWA